MLFSKLLGFGSARAMGNPRGAGTTDPSHNELDQSLHFHKIEPLWPVMAISSSLNGGSNQLSEVLEELQL